MSLTFLTFDSGPRRWWVVRGPAGATALTAVVLPPGTPTLSGEITAPDGARLLPDVVEHHRHGDSVHGKDCPALGGDCDGGTGDYGGARQLLDRWVSEGYDDAWLRESLIERYAAEFVPEVPA